MNNPSHEKKTSNALKADRVIHRVTFNTNKTSPGEILHIPVPKLGDGVVLVPGTLALIFDLTVSGHANNFLVNNVARALVDRFTVKFTGEILQDTNGYDLIKLYEDLFLTEKERAGRISEGIQSEDLSKIRCGSGDKKTSGVAKEIKLIREIKFDVTWSYGKRQTGKMKLLPSVFSSLNTRVKISEFVANSRRHFSTFM